MDLEHQRSVGAGSHTVTRVTWCVPPPPPPGCRFRGTSWTQKSRVHKVLCWMCLVRIPPSTCVQMAWKPHPLAHLAHTRKLRAGARHTYQSHTHTLSPSHLPYSGSQVFSYKTFPGPTFQPSHPQRWGKGCKEGRTKAIPFLDGAFPQCFPTWAA